MINYKKWGVVTGVGMLLCVTSYAQPVSFKQVLKTGVGKTSQLANKVERSVLRNRAYKYAPSYNRVLGYKTARTHQYFRPDFGDGSSLYDRRIQAIAKTTRTSELNLVPMEKASLPQLTQFIYRWRLANPDKPLEDFSIMGQLAKQIRDKKFQEIGRNPLYVEEYPHVLFLARLLEPSFTPQTYAQLAAQTDVYPTYVTLNGDGIPVTGEQAQQAGLLDEYLMLANQRMMGRFNSGNVNVPGADAAQMYTPFTLTREEKLAAEQLFAKRQQAYHLPPNATQRQLLANAYNQLESHTIAYYTPAQQAQFAAEFFVDYPHTELYKQIKAKLARMEGSVWRESTDMSHLVVLDAIMGGLAENWQDTAAVNRALDAFEKLCKETPATPENTAHLALLHSSLLKSSGIWEYLPDSHVARTDFDKMKVDEIRYLQERVANFANLQVAKLMHP